MQKKGEGEEGGEDEVKPEKKAPKKKTDGLKQTKLKFDKIDDDDDDEGGGILSDSPPPPPRTVMKRQSGKYIYLIFIFMIDCLIKCQFKKKKN